MVNPELELRFLDMPINFRYNTSKARVWTGNCRFLTETDIRKLLAYTVLIIIS